MRPNRPVLDEFLHEKLLVGGFVGRGKCWRCQQVVPDVLIKKC
jgi:hypothetical protein